MRSGTLVLIILAAIVALALALYQYYYRSKRKGSLKAILCFLRFSAVFGIFLLLINPKFTREEYSLEKANLVFLLDNSSSLNTTNATGDLLDVFRKLKENKDVTEKFNLDIYNFGSQLNKTDSISFSEKSTNITDALTTINEVYSKTNTAVVLVTDGNQTIGEDYEFYGGRQEFPVYSIAVGDTTSYEDIRIDQINSNRYAFLKNKFPIEVYASYHGKGNVSSSLTISIGGKAVYRENLAFTNTSTSKIVNTLLDANSVGVKNINVRLTPLENERNIVNNTRNHAVEVIDEKTNIAIISDILHPDIGALKKALESNEQRSVSIRKPSLSAGELDEVDLFVLYQPNTTFKTIYDFIEKKGVNSFTLSGTKTDWDFLNNVQTAYKVEDGYPNQEILPIVNRGFSKFDLSDLSTENFPPLGSNVGPVDIGWASESILKMSIKGVEMATPILTILEGPNKERQALLFGENIWKWRAQSYRNDKNFKNFDEFIGKVILYLSANKSKSRLSVDYQNTYQGTRDAKITATYFDETFVFDGNANILLSLKGSNTSFSREIPMLLKNGYYEADISAIPTGKYNFQVTVKNETLSRSGNFIMLDFDIEQQFMSSNYSKLDRLARTTGGTLYFPEQADGLLEDLNSNTGFVPTQISKQNVVSLVDFRVLLGFIVAALAAEWFIRKYNGLI